MLPMSDLHIGPTLVTWKAEKCVVCTVSQFSSSRSRFDPCFSQAEKIGVVKVYEVTQGSRV